MFGGAGDGAGQHGKDQLTEAVGVTWAVSLGTCPGRGAAQSTGFGTKLAPILFCCVPAVGPQLFPPLLSVFLFTCEREGSKPTVKAIVHRTLVCAE